MDNPKLDNNRKQKPSLRHSPSTISLDSSEEDPMRTLGTRQALPKVPPSWRQLIALPVR